LSNNDLHMFQAMAASKGPGLYEFLIEAELQQYYSCFKNDLKIQNVPQLKYVNDEDLVSVGLSKPEIRRLKKYFQKHFPQNYLLKFKKVSFFICRFLLLTAYTLSEAWSGVNWADLKAA